MTLQRTPVNLTTWSLSMGFNQGEVVSGQTRTLYLSGQTAMSDEGRPLHDANLGKQLTLAFDNVESVLRAADMTLAHLVRLNVYTTDIDALMPHYGVLAGRLAAAGVAPTTTMLQVARLAVPGQLVELEGTAVA